MTQQQDMDYLKLWVALDDLIRHYGFDYEETYNGIQEDGTHQYTINFFPEVE